MKYKIHPHKLDYIFPFKIAHTTRDHTLSAYLELYNEENKAWGEVVFPPYYPETIDSFIDFMGKIVLPKNINDLNIKDFMDEIDCQISDNQFSKAALDIALHNFKSRLLGRNIRSTYKIKGEEKPTSFTIGISSNEEMLNKLKFASSFEYIKLKVVDSDIERIIAFFETHCNKPFVVDANQGFTNKEEALRWCVKLNKKGVAYFEQPFDKEDFSSHKWLKERSPIPIIADESFQTVSDLNEIKDCFDGVNIKLMKCGGIAHAYDCFWEAKKFNLKTVLGCMSESSVAIDAARTLSPLADWVDLDGHFLIKNDFKEKDWV